MAKMNIKNIENVEGEYHLMFFEGKNIVESAKNDLRNAWISLLFFASFIVFFILISDFNLFYVGFMLAYLVFFLTVVIYLSCEKKKGMKQCVYAVQKSRTTDIVNKQVDTRKVSKAFVRSMSNTLDKYDTKEKYPHMVQKFKRKRRHAHLVSAINDFEKEGK